MSSYDTDELSARVHDRFVMVILKIIKNTVLISLIIIIFFIPIFIYLVKFKNNSFPGEYLKGIALKTPKLITLFNLNEPGDARYLYFDPEDKSISVGIISVNHEKANDLIEAWLKDMIFQTVGKNASVGTVQNIGYPKMKLLTNEDLNEIRKTAVLQSNSELYLIYTSSYAEKESSVGVVIHRDTIFIFRDAIETLSERGYIKDVLEKTTIMHEWGHLLGMDHVDDTDCIMNELVEVYDNFPIGVDIPTEYCQKELREISKNLFF